MGVSRRSSITGESGHLTGSKEAPLPPSVHGPFEMFCSSRSSKSIDLEATRPNSSANDADAELADGRASRQW